MCWDRKLSLGILLMATHWVNVKSIGSFFASLSDPRHTRNRKHRLLDIVVSAIEDGQRLRRPHRHPPLGGQPARMATILPPSPQRHPLPRLPLPPSDDAATADLSGVLPGLERPAVQADANGPTRLIAIDGKTCRRSHGTTNGLGPLHIVSD